ncbi:Type I restriction-modification system, specificity subunit S [Helicobacter heilmannii]|uniref:Type I restriction-modification system, specificity subunit S n=2 Tax=Helicobacter heilmannii TaxID=35817 RepID=A0A0K2YAP8_HELHE|nr:Type I restriction-modification system, specificity subunit S [Helicobacter heilmannii]
MEGLEHLPAGWGVKRLYDVAFQPKDRIRISHLTPKNYVGVDNLLQNGQGKREATFIPKGNAKTSGYAQNDILIGNIRPYLKKIWLADTEGGTNGDVVVLRVRNAGVVAPRFLYYVLRRDAFFDYMMRFIKGVKMPRGDKKAILNFTIPLPPLKEQHAIAAFLDDKTSKLDRLITKKSCLLQSLKAYKHALISEVATKGLAATPTKQSGLDWLGEIPTGWELRRLGDLFYIRNGYTPSTTNPEFWQGGNIPWFRMEDIRKNGRILNDSIRHITPLGVRGALFKAGSIILATTATIGEHALIKVDFVGNQQFSILTLKESFKNALDLKFAFYFFFVVGDWCLQCTRGTTFASVDITRLKNLFIPLPPLPEQHAIAAFLDEKTQKLDRLMAKLQTQIKALKAYKSALISEAVLGQIPLKDRL